MAPQGCARIARRNGRWAPWARATQRVAEQERQPKLVFRYGWLMAWDVVLSVQWHNGMPPAHIQHMAEAPCVVLTTPTNSGAPCLAARVDACCVRVDAGVLNPAQNVRSRRP